MFLITNAHAAQPIKAPCDGADYEQLSSELKALFDADQGDRKDFTQWTEKRAVEVLKRDRVRRRKVAELFAQGCLKSANDYYYAATVFQHGEVPDHFFQTFIWASKAFKAGKEDAGSMAANGADRYLMNLGFKQSSAVRPLPKRAAKGLRRTAFVSGRSKRVFQTKNGMSSSSRRGKNLRNGSRSSTRTGRVARTAFVISRRSRF